MTDPPAPEPSSLGGSPPRRLRRAGVVRRRYKGARWIAAALGGLAALASAGSTLSRLEAGPSPAFLAGAALLVALGAAGGWLLVELLWRRARRRNHWRWQ